MIHRCGWVPEDKEIYVNYHDTEWGVPIHDDQKLFEFLILEGFQAGLSWLTILNKRENFKKAFDNFNARIIAQYDQHKINELLYNSGIIRNKLKIKAAITNAQTYLKIIEKHGSFDKYIWQFTEGKTIKNRFSSWKDIPASTNISDRMSKELKGWGFKFRGTTICYAFMQAVGMVNDHEISCFRYSEVNC